MPRRASKAIQARLPRPRGRMKKATTSGAIDWPRLPPTWKTDWARPNRPPEAMRARREDSGWKIEEPMPISAAPRRRSG